MGSGETPDQPVLRDKTIPLLHQSGKIWFPTPDFQQKRIVDRGSTEVDVPTMATDHCVEQTTEFGVTLLHFKQTRSFATYARLWATACRPPAKECPAL